jgi:hypothetical protein
VVKRKVANLARLRPVVGRSAAPVVHAEKDLSWVGCTPVAVIRNECSGSENEGFSDQCSCAARNVAGPQRDEFEIDATQLSAQFFET